MRKLIAFKLEVDCFADEIFLFFRNADQFTSNLVIPKLYATTQWGFVENLREKEKIKDGKFFKIEDME